MRRREKHQVSGFTLIELVIVLGIAGVLMGGIWRLLATSNQQVRDQSVANQHAELVSSVKTYLQTTQGQDWLRALDANTQGSLALPPAATPAGSGSGCVTALGTTSGLCSILPPGTSLETTNAYGHSYKIQVLKDSSPAGTDPKSYSFMILTTGSDPISDTSGGRIAAMIGGDGGFIYNTGVCNPPSDPFSTFACGAYGAWAVKPAAVYGFSNSDVVKGTVASRTYYSMTQNVEDLWLARKFVMGDDTTSPAHNTMTESLLLGGHPTYFGTAKTPGATTGGGSMYLQGGTIDLGPSGKILGTSGPGGGDNSGGIISLVGNMSKVGLSTSNSVLQVTSTCSKSSFSDDSCNYVGTFNGSATVTEYFYAGALYSEQFVYNGSDRRLKKDIKPLEAPLEKVMKLKPVSFVYKKGERKGLGVIAQDLQEIFPDLVIEGPESEGSESEEGSMKAVNYEGLIAPLIGAVQELKKENDELRAQFKEQRIRHENMEKEMMRLRRR